MSASECARGDTPMIGCQKCTRINAPFHTREHMRVNPGLHRCNIAGVGGIDDQNKSLSKAQLIDALQVSLLVVLLPHAACQLCNKQAFTCVESDCERVHVQPPKGIS